MTNSGVTMKKNLLNLKTLTAWQEIDELNWKVLVTELVNIFFHAGGLQMEELNNAWSNRNLDKVQRAAHALKSSCGNVGAQMAFHLLDQIEDASANNDIEKVGALMVEFQPIFFESCAQVSEFAVTLQAA